METHKIHILSKNKMTADLIKELESYGDIKLSSIENKNLAIFNITSNPYHPDEDYLSILLVEAEDLGIKMYVGFPKEDESNLLGADAPPSVWSSLDDVLLK